MICPIALPLTPNVAEWPAATRRADLVRAIAIPLRERSMAWSATVCVGGRPRAPGARAAPLHDLAGWPSTRTLAKGTSYSHNTIHGLFTSRQVPNRQLFFAVVDKLIELAGQVDRESTLAHLIRSGGVMPRRRSSRSAARRLTRPPLRRPARRPTCGGSLLTPAVELVSNSRLKVRAS